MSHITVVIYTTLQYIKTTSTWYIKRLFNRNSLLMSDFIATNSLNIVDFNFIYKSYIDHVLATEQVEISDCKILSKQQDNVSEHFPVTVKVVLQFCQGYSENNKTNNAIKRKLPWQRGFVSTYVTFPSGTL